MIDRNVEFPNRFQLQKVQGTDDIYDIIPAPGDVIAPGDLFSKGNMLPDEIVSLLGLKMGNPQVKDALNVLANVGNLHVWENKQLTDVPAHITENAVSNLEVFYATAGSVNPTSSRYSITYYVADSITVNDSGDITLSNPTEVTCYIPDSTYSEYYNADALKGKYIKVKELGSSYVYNRVLGSGVFKIAQNAVFSVSNPKSYTGMVTVDKAYSCVGIPLSKDGTITYLTSTDRNAYPDQSAEGGRDAYYTLGDVVTGSFYMGIPAAWYTNIYTYSSSLSVSDDGAVSLANPSNVTSSRDDLLSTDAINSTLVGKFVQWTCQDQNSLDTKYPFNASPSPIIFIPSDAKITVTTPDVNERFTLSKYQPVTGHAAIPANTTITYLGQLGDGARIEVGSYVGTGTYGSGNKNTLTFKNKRPKMVTVVPKTHSNNSEIILGSFPFVNGAESAVARLYLGAYSTKNVNLSWSDDSVSWYSTESADIQLNENSTIYFYVAEF